MYERMLNKLETPNIEEMTKFCGKNSERFSLLNEWLVSAFNTEKKVVFPYGNKYGWGIGHYKKKKYTQEVIDKKYPCSNGGWIQYRVICQEHYEDIKKLLEVKCL